MRVYRSSYRNYTSMPHRERKQKMFDLGREALTRLKGQDVGYACPICLQCYKNVDELTEEHVPPKSLGGKVLCLTCLKCNCSAGYGVDAQVHQKKLSQTFFAPDGHTYRAKLIMNGQELNIDLQHSNNDVKMQVLGDQNNPKAIKALRSLLSNSNQPVKSFQLRDKVSYSERSADVGYLKAAYLAAFAKLGYTYIRSQALDRLRQQIQDPTCKILETVCVHDNKSSISEKFFFLFYEPISCLSVKIEDSIVCLPLPYGDDLFYEKLSEMRASNKVYTWRSNGTIKWPERLELTLDFE